MEGEVAASGGIVDIRRIPETAEGQPSGELEMFEISMPWMMARLRKGSFPIIRSVFYET